MWDVRVPDSDCSYCITTPGPVPKFLFHKNYETISDNCLFYTEVIFIVRGTLLHRSGKLARDA